jgi:hypothetical protein
MYFYDSMKDLKLYKNRTFMFPYANGDARRGNLYFLSGKDMEDSIKILNSNIISNRFNMSYYVDNIINLDIGAVLRRERIIQKDHYSTIRSRSADMKRMFPQLQNYQGLNLYYELFPYNELFFENVKYNGGRKAELYAEFISGIMNSQSWEEYGYKKKYVIIPFDDTIGGNFKENFLNQNNIKNPLSAIYNLVYFDEEKFKKNFEGIDFVVISNKSNVVFKFNAESLNRRELPRLQTILSAVNKFNSKQELDSEEKAIAMETIAEFQPEIEDEAPIINVKENVMNAVKKEFGVSGGVKSLTGEEAELTQKLDDVAEKVAKKKTIESSSEMLDELNNNEEFAKYAEQLKQEKLTAAKANRNSKRNELLKEEHKKVKINNQGKSLEEIVNEMGEKKLDVEEIKIDVKNTNLKKSTLKDFEVSYNKKQMTKDTMMIINSFASNKEIPLYVRDIKKENTSDSFNKKETWTVTFEDERRARHTVKIDMPIFVNDKFIYLNGSKKSISKQLMLIPVAKTGPGTVQCTSNYNKAFIMRYGQKISPKIERLRKYLSQVKSTKIKMVSGDNNLANTDYLTNIDYDELASSFMTITVGENVFHFNQENFREELASKKIDISKLKDEQLPVGLKGKTLIILDAKTNKIIGTDSDLPDYIVDEATKVDPKTLDELENVSVGKKYVYTRVSAINRKIPLVILLAFREGLSTVLRKANVRHEFSDKRRRLTLEEKNTVGMVQFSDGFLYYDLYPFRNSLLLNALQEVPTNQYSYSDFDGKEVYLELFFSMYGTRTIGKGFDNFCELFIDPITKEVLEELGYPTDFTELFLFANALLEDNTFTKENDMNLYRIRSNEMLNAYLYQILADGYATYKNTSNSSNPIKISVPQDKLLKELMESPLVQDYSVINPIFEAEAYGSVTYKGPSGLNLDEAFTLDKRSYDESMLGLLAISSPYNNKVGVSRQLAYNPRILSNRGLIRAGKKDDADLGLDNMLSPAELLTPFAANHDDPPRTAMTSGQSKHVIPVKKTDKLLIGNGSEKALPHILGNDFVHRAKQDGVVEMVDEKSGIMILKYKDGSHDSVDLSPAVARNGGGGFFISNTKVSDLKKGDRFKQGEILAKNGEYFKGDKSNTEYVIGNLTKVAIHSGYYTFEDSAIATEKFCKEMTSLITMKKEVILGPNTNVDFIAKKGQPIKTGDPLIIFEQSYAEKEANELLAKLGDELQEKITKLSKNYVKSKYTGVVEDVKIYYTCEKEELSPSLQKVVKQYKSEVKSKEDILKKYFKSPNDTDIVLPPTETIETKDGKVKGVDVGNGILIEFYVKYEDELGVGDKVSFYTALKSILAEKLPDEVAPYSETRPDEQIDCILGTRSVNNRMTGSVFLALFGNKVLVEMKEKVREIWNE